MDFSENLVVFSELLVDFSRNLEVCRRKFCGFKQLFFSVWFFPGV